MTLYDQMYYVKCMKYSEYDFSRNCLNEEKDASFMRLSPLTNIETKFSWYISLSKYRMSERCSNNKSF